MYTLSEPKGFKRLIVMFGLVALCVPVSLDAQSIVHVTAENKQTLLTIKEIPDLSKTPVARLVNRKLMIKIETKKDGSVKEFVHRETLCKIDKVEFCIADKALLIGKLPYRGDSIIVLDTKIGKVQDTIRAYGYSISPSKRFLVYKTWYPRLGPIHLRKSILLLYDLGKPQAANRYPCISKYSYRNAGFPIFPEANAYFTVFDPNCLDSRSNLKPYDVNLDDEYYVTSPFLWSDDEKQLVFFVFNRNEQRNYLVQIDFNNGIVNPAIFRNSINMDDLIKWDIILDITKKELAKRPYKFRVKSLHWRDKNKIVVEPYRQYWLDKELEIPLP